MYIVQSPDPIYKNWSDPYSVTEYVAAISEFSSLIGELNIVTDPDSVGPALVSVTGSDNLKLVGTVFSDRICCGQIRVCGSGFNRILPFLKCGSESN